VIDHLQLPTPEQGVLYAVDTTSQPISETAVGGEAFDDIYKFNDFPPAGPSLPELVASHTADDVLLTTPASWTLPSYGVHFAVNNEPLPTAASLPAQISLSHLPYGVQYNNAPSNYEYYRHTQGAEVASESLEEFNFSQPDLSATPDISVGFYPQVSYPRVVDVDQGYQGYPYTTATYPATAESTFGMQGLFAW